MFLYRIHLNLRCPDARRDLADPYQLHSTLSRIFAPPGGKCPAGELLWRIEPETDSAGLPLILMQGRTNRERPTAGPRDWSVKVDPPIDLMQRLQLSTLEPGRRFRFRLRANPSVTREGKRLGLLRLEDQEAWIARKGQQHGFSIPRLTSFHLPESSRERIDVRVSQERTLNGRQHTGNQIRVYSVLYDGILTVTEPGRFVEALRTGIGHGKVMGLGLLSIAPTEAFSG